MVLRWRLPAVFVALLAVIGTAVLTAAPAEARFFHPWGPWFHPGPWLYPRPVYFAPPPPPVYFVPRVAYLAPPPVLYAYRYRYHHVVVHHAYHHIAHAAVHHWCGCYCCR